VRAKHECSGAMQKHENITPTNSKMEAFYTL